MEALGGISHKYRQKLSSLDMRRTTLLLKGFISLKLAQSHEKPTGATIRPDILVIGFGRAPLGSLHLAQENGTVRTIFGVQTYLVS
jgi:hypothetical protein